MSYQVRGKAGAAKDICECRLLAQSPPAIRLERSDVSEIGRQVSGIAAMGIQANPNPWLD